MGEREKRVGALQAQSRQARSAKHEYETALSRDPF